MNKLVNYEKGLVVETWLQVSIINSEDIIEAKSVASKHIKKLVPGYQRGELFELPESPGNGKYILKCQLRRKFGTKNVSRARGDFR